MKVRKFRILPPAAPCQHGGTWPGLRPVCAADQRVELSEGVPYGTGNHSEKFKMAWNVSSQSVWKMRSVCTGISRCRNALMQRVGEDEYEL